jgi:hypothetical protein
MALAAILLFLVLLDPFFPPRGHTDSHYQTLVVLKWLPQAMSDYHASHGHFPPAATHDKEGRLLHSWRVLILPHLGVDDFTRLYKQFKLDEPWDSPHNKPLLGQMPACYRDPLDPSPDRTYFQVLVGPGTAFEREGLSLLRDFPDGLENTLLVVQGSNSVLWTQPKDVVYAPDKPIPGLRHYNRFVRWLGYLPWRQVVTRVCRADGCVLDLAYPVEERFLRSIIVRNDGEKVDWDKHRPR